MLFRKPESLDQTVQEGGTIQWPNYWFWERTDYVSHFCRQEWKKKDVWHL